MPLYHCQVFNCLLPQAIEDIHRNSHAHERKLHQSHFIEFDVNYEFYIFFCLLGVFLYRTVCKWLIEIIWNVMKPLDLHVKANVHAFDKRIISQIVKTLVLGIVHISAEF